jgi:hypothetical protein
MSGDFISTLFSEAWTLSTARKEAHITSAREAGKERGLKTEEYSFQLIEAKLYFYALS